MSQHDYDQVLPNLEEMDVEWHKKNLERALTFHKQKCEELGLTVEDIQVLVRGGVQ